MNERSLVNKVIALLSFGQTQVAASFKFDVQTILFAFLQRLESQLEMSVFIVVVMFFKSLMMRILCCLNVELKSSFLCVSYGQDSKVLEVIHNL